MIALASAVGVVLAKPSVRDLGNQKVSPRTAGGPVRQRLVMRTILALAAAILFEDPGVRARLA
jgi:hypothetical protein